MAVKAPSFPGFTPLSDRIFLRNEEPDSAARAKPSDEPSTIIIYGWGDGQPKHVAKYVDGYHRLYPSARIVVVISPTMTVLFHSLAQRTEAMRPIIDAVFPTPADGTERVILHAMSNTGGISAAATLNAYRERHGANRALPHQLCVSDSTPGSLVFSTEVGRWSRAMALGTAKWFPWPFAMTQGLWWTLLYAGHLLGMVTGVEPAGVYSCRAFLDPSMASARALRLYMYSKEDDLIGWKDVETQAGLARSSGYTTILEMFDGSPHVGHMRMHPNQYWGAIVKHWKESMALEEKKEGEEKGLQGREVWVEQA